MRKALAVLLLAASVQALAALPAAAAPPVVEDIHVQFPDGSCGETQPMATSLHVRFTDQILRNGLIHHWIELSGTATNESNGRVVHISASRRYHIDEASDWAQLGGLQVQFRAQGAGVLWQNAGWASGVNSEALDTYETRGRWDGVTSALPEAVCSYLLGKA